MLYKWQQFSLEMYIFNATGPSFGCEVAYQTAEGIGASAVHTTAVESFLVFITRILWISCLYAHICQTLMTYQSKSSVLQQMIGQFENWDIGQSPCAPSL